MRQPFFLSHQRDGAYFALGVLRMCAAGVFNDVYVGALRTGRAFHCAVPAFGETVEGADVKSPAVKDANFGRYDVVAENFELAVDIFVRSKDVGHPDGGAVEWLRPRCRQHGKVQVHGTVASVMGLQHDKRFVGRFGVCVAVDPGEGGGVADVYFLCLMVGVFDNDGVH